MEFEDPPAEDDVSEDAGSPLDERPNGGLTYRRLNEIYLNANSEKRIEDGVEVTIYTAGPLFIEKAEIEPSEGYTKHLAMLDQLHRDLVARIDWFGAKLNSGVRLHDLL